MNYKLIFRLLSFIMGALVLAFLLCLFVAHLYREDVGDGRAVFAFGLSALLAFVLGAFFYLGGRGGETRFFRKEALCVIGVGWILASLTGAIPYLILLEGSSVADAIFESASGITTTGATVLTDLENLPRSLIFWRALSQWMGGMGVVVFFVAILGFLGAGGKILFSGESTAKSADMEQSRVQKGVLQLFYLYTGMTAACLLVLRFCGMSWYDAVCHTFATVSTGGYGTRTDSIAAFQSPLIEWALIVFMVLGATNFFFLILVIRRKWEQARANTEVIAYLGILLIAGLFMALFLETQTFGEGIHHSIRTALFQTVSLSTTTGFATADFDQWPLFNRMALLSLMVIGGCSASTAGGMKMVRLVVAFRMGVQSVERAFRTHVVRRVVVNDRPLDPETQESILVYIVLLGLILLMSFPIFALFETGHSLEGAVSAVVATLFNIGPGFGEFGPGENYAVLGSPTKLYLSLLMVMGRLELFAILVLFAPSLWRKFS